MSPDAYLEMAETEASHWWFAGRRAVLASLITRLELPANAKILEIGSGTGGNLPMLSCFGQVSALEMNATARSVAEQRDLLIFEPDFAPQTYPSPVRPFT